MKITNVSFAIVLIPVVFSACSKLGSSSTTQPNVPSATISDVMQERSTATSTFKFKVALNEVAPKDVTIQYATADGDAIQNKDYLPASGSLKIAAGSQAGEIDVQVTGDSLRQPNRAFYVQLSNAQSCTLSNNKAIGTIVDENGLFFPVDNTGYTTPTSYIGYNLAWSDEFSGSTINTNNWVFENGNNNGWGNSELENYTDRIQNAFVSAGNLIIEARQETFGGNNYTSARMKTEGKQNFEYGRIDIRAKMPTGKGIWPALWLLGNNIGTVGWPACGEIDLMELLGQQPNTIYGTLHWGATPALHQSKGTNYVLGSGSFDQQFHVYSLLWAQDSVKMLIDDHQYFSATGQDITGGNITSNPFNNNFFLIFNMAVGGSWPGSPDGTTQFPQRMIVDYIRVFQK